MKYLIGIVALCFIAGTGCKPKEQPADAQTEQSAAPLKFEFKVKRAGNSLVFKSVKGNEWTDLSYACKELPCEFALNNFGVNSNIPATVYSIKFKLSAKEVEMASASMAPLKGSNWETLKYACEAKECEFAVTEEGVAGIGKK